MIRDDIDYGSRSYDRVVEAVGEEAATVLAREFGGQLLYIPAKVKDGCKIANVIGKAATAQLVEALGRGEFPIRKTYPALNPVAAVRVDPNVSPHERNRKIAAARREGAKVSELVREFGVTERTIYNVLREYGLTNSGLSRHASA